MSRIGKLPVNIVEGVNVELNGLSVDISGPRGVLKKTFKGGVDIEKSGNKLLVTPSSSSKFSRAMWGTVRSILNNMLIGVTKGFEEELIIKGVGYRASVKDKYLNLTLGKSHNTKIEIPETISITVPKPDLIKLESVDKDLLGQICALIKAQRKVEPYKGKGIRKSNEFVYRKEGKRG